MWCRFVVGILLRNGYRLHVTTSSVALPVNGFREIPVPKSLLFILLLAH